MKSIPLSSSRRGISVRDVIKCCDRCELDFKGINLPAIIPAKMKEIIFMHTIDTYCCAVPKPELRRIFIDIIANTWGISTDRKIYILDSYKPTITASRTQLAISNMILDVHQNTSLVNKISEFGSKFAYSRQSSILIEKLARSVNMKEPVLLVGETGCGKTKVVQHLAHLLNKTLIVLNLNQQVILSLKSASPFFQ
jgi:midasin